MKKSTLITSLIFASSALIAVPSAFAGGCAPGQPCYEQYSTKPRAKDAPMVAKSAPAAPQKTVAAKMMDKASDISMALSAGVNVLHNDCQDASVAGGVYADFRKEGVPINVRVGAEVANLNADDFEFEQGSRFFGEQPDFIYVRVPLSVEYIQPINEKTELLVGGGPDFIHTSGNNGVDGDIGFHLGARIVRDISEHFSASIGAGYLWADTDPSGEDLDLDGAFTGASIGYRF